MKFAHHTADSGYIFGGYYDESDAYMVRRPDGMSDWLLLYTVGGSGYFQTPEGRKECTEGDVTLLRSGVPHQYGTLPGQRWRFFWSHFQGLPEIGYLPQVEVWNQSISSEYYRVRIGHAFRNLLHDSRERAGMWEFLCQNAIREVLLLSCESLHSPLDPRVQTALHWLTRNMAEDITVEELARSVALSPSRLSHLFKQETGLSILEYRNRMRIQQAALLIRHMKKTAGEAALEVGFSNYNHFSRLFKKQFSVCPKDYRP